MNYLSSFTLALLALYLVSTTVIGQCTHESVTKAISPELWREIITKSDVPRIRVTQYIDKASEVVEKMARQESLFVVSEPFFQVKMSEVALMKEQFEADYYIVKWLHLSQQEKMSEMVLELMARIIYRWDKAVYQELFSASLQINTVDSFLGSRH